MKANTVVGLGAVLLLAGAGIGIFGVTYYTSTVGGCSPYYLAVYENPGGYDDAPVVAFQNLSAAQQEAFRATLATEPHRPGSYQMPVSEDAYFGEPTRVVYQNHTYLAVTLSNDGCMPTLLYLSRILPLATAATLAIGGIVLLHRGHNR